jgi:hypothetical protein
MCKTNVETKFYYFNICKHEYENNMIRLWCKIVLKTIRLMLNRLKEMKGPTPIYTPISLVQGSSLVPKEAYVCIKEVF